MSNITTTSYRSADGTRLHGFIAVPDAPRYVVLLCHGLGEHCRRYDHVAEYLNELSIAVLACDLRGHGESSGKRGHIERWSDYVDDVTTLHDKATALELDNLPWIQFGHSMGGLVAVHAALRNPEKLVGLALSGPLLGVAHEVPAIKAYIGNTLSKLWPSLTLANEIDAAVISRDPDTVAAYKADPLVHDRVSARWFTEMNSALETAQQRAPELKLPIWLAHGTADKLTDPLGSRRFLDRVSGPTDAHFLDGWYHEIFNEPKADRAYALQLLTDWIQQQG